MRTNHISRLRRAEEKVHAAIPDKRAEELLMKMAMDNLRAGLWAYGYDLDNPKAAEQLAARFESMGGRNLKWAEAVRSIHGGKK